MSSNICSDWRTVASRSRVVYDRAGTGQPWRQHHGEARGVLGGPLERVVEAVPGEDLLHQRQADALAVRLGAEERREQVRLRLRGSCPGRCPRSTSVGGPRRDVSRTVIVPSPSIASIAFFRMLSSACSICPRSIAHRAPPAASSSQRQVMPTAFGLRAEQPHDALRASPPDRVGCVSGGGRRKTSAKPPHEARSAARSAR